MDLAQILYPKSIEEAKEIQLYLRSQLILKPLGKKPAIIASADSSFSDNLVLAAVCLFSFPDLKLLETATAIEPLNFPYRPGYLSFCEGPAIYRALIRLNNWPDLLICDGQGIAHPRRVGLATFMGIVTGIPSIGCAKSLLVGTYKEPEVEKGSYSEIHHQGEIVGYALRTRRGVRPIFISPGHLIDLQDSLQIIKNCLSSYRLPQPQRQAHQITQKIKSLNR